MSTSTAKKFRSRVEVVTPEQAEKWLEERNTSNRQLTSPLTDNTVERYARDMRNNRWHLTGDAIKFDTENVLLDGQHRLWACVISEQAFETLVAYNVDPTARIVIDTGKKRTFGHYLQMKGERDSVQLAAVVNLCYRWDAGNIAGDGSIRNVNGSNGRLIVSHEEALSWLENNVYVRDSVKFGRAFQKDMKWGATPASAAHYLNARVDVDEADAFWKFAAAGENLPGGSAILALRRFALNVVTRQRQNGTAISSEVALVYCLKAMDLWRKDKSVRLLHVKDGDNVTVWK